MPRTRPDLLDDPNLRRAQVTATATMPTRTAVAPKRSRLRCLLLLLILLLILLLGPALLLLHRRPHLQQQLQQRAPEPPSIIPVPPLDPAIESSARQIAAANGGELLLTFVQDSEEARNYFEQLRAAQL